MIRLSIILPTIVAFSASVSCFVPKSTTPYVNVGRKHTATNVDIETKTENNDASTTTKMSLQELFDDFAEGLQSKQSQIISEIESMDTSGQSFCKDTWGVFADDYDAGAGNGSGSGGITRVIQKGNVVEKGACSFTLLRDGKLTAERAAAIQGRQKNEIGVNIQEGDVYSAAALSMVLHTRSPMIPTFRSDVRIFMVKPSDGTDPVAWFGGGSDLTPYYLFDEDITFFHERINDLCEQYGDDDECQMVNYKQMKKACDEYFYLPARSEHRGTGGMFFDDLPATPKTMNFVNAVVTNWMSSWFPIIEKRRDMEYTEQQREWQLLRRGRYLEFNLLYDRGVKFGLQTANPRVEGVMVSAPPLIAWEYNHAVEKGSEEDRLMEILKSH